MRLPFGFSPTQALHTVADKANPFDGTDTDYDVFRRCLSLGGDRSPANGAFIGPQVMGASTGGGDQTGGAAAATNGATGLGGGGFYDPYAALSSHLPLA